MICFSYIESSTDDRNLRPRGLIRTGALGVNDEQPAGYTGHWLTELIHLR